MKVCPTAIPGVLLIKPSVFEDARGFLYESFNQQAFDAAVGSAPRFVQDNHSRSHRGVLRGLHYQLPPHAQGKLIYVVRGSVWDVAVDIRRHSPTFGQWVGVELSEGNRRQLWIPPGFAHGFAALSDGADVIYKMTRHYQPEAERGIAWNDPQLAIAWPTVQGGWLLSDQDRQWPGLSSVQ